LTIKPHLRRSWALGTNEFGSTLIGLQSLINQISGFPRDFFRPTHRGRNNGFCGFLIETHAAFQNLRKFSLFLVQLEVYKRGVPHWLYSAVSSTTTTLSKQPLQTPNTMFASLAAFSTFAILAAAMPNGGQPTKTVTVTVTAPPSGTQPASQCNTGPVQCCNSVVSQDNAAASTLLSLLGIVLQGVTADVGLTCSPLSVVGVGSGAVCNASPVCCQNNDFSALIAIGCSPVNILL